MLCIFKSKRYYTIQKINKSRLLAENISDLAGRYGRR